MSNFRWIAGHIFKLKGWILLTTIVLVLESLSSIAMVWLQQSMIDDVLLAKGDRWAQFISVLIQLSLAYIMFSIMFTLSPLMVHIVYRKMRNWLAANLIGKMYRTPMEKFQKERTANYVYHFTHDLENTSMMLVEDIPRLIQQITSAAVMIWILAEASPILLFVVVGFCIPYIALGKKFAGPRKKASSEMNRDKSALLVHLEEGVSSTREVLAFRREKWEEKRYHTFFDKYFLSVMNEAKLINKQLLNSEPLRVGANLAVLFIGGWLVLQGNLSIGLYVVAFQFTSEIMRTLNGLYNSVMQYAGKIAIIERLRSVLDGPTIKDGEFLLQEPIRDLKLEKLTFRYEDRKESVLSNVSVAFPIGHKIAFVGTSGGGKSTIASLLVRYFDPIEGQILVNDQPLHDINRKDWSKRLAVVFQEPYLFPESIRTNLFLGLQEITDEEMVKVCQDMCIHEVIQGLPEGYDTVIGERGITLSGGQRQRLALARAMLHNPEILILDEATSSLDMETEREVQLKIDEHRQGRSTFVIAHRLSTIRNAEVIYVLDKGTIVEQGTHDELMQARSVYSSLVLKQSEQLSS